ncbi:DNA polymerase I [Nocardia tengchongensis]|uniref:DNA polymerase I n=1 Tax=Nocardia tengchongensis TaxID=2055889 RepID=UPI00365B74B0
MTLDLPAALLLDVPAMAAHAYRSVPPATATSPDGQTTNAVAGFMTELLDAAEEHPTHIVAVFDGPAPNSRAQLLAGYRGTPTNAAVERQLPLLRDLLNVLGIATLDAPAGAEAADMIASLTARLGVRCSIVSTDERLFQCIDGPTVLIRPAPGRAADHLTADTIATHIGLPGPDIVDFLALRGDRTRGLAPIPGMGEKTALTQLRQHRSLDTVLTHNPKLQAHADRIRHHRQVLTLDTALPIPALPDLAKPQLPDDGKTTQAFAGLGLPGLATRTLAVLGTPELPAPATEHIEPGHMQTWLASHAANRVGNHAVVLTATAAAITAVDRATAHLDLATATDQDRAALGEWLSAPDVHKTVHDAKAMIHRARELGWNLAGVALDTELAGYLINSGAAEFTITALAHRHLKPAPGPGDTDTLSGEAAAEPDAAADARRIATLAPVLDDELARAGMFKLYWQIERPTTTVLAALEDRGVAVDRTQLDALRTEYSLAAAAATDAATTVLGHPINLASAAQLQNALFVELKLPPTRPIRNGHSTAADELARLQKHIDHPVLTHLRDYRTAIKLAQMVAGLTKHITADGRLHTTFHQTKVETGRLSSEAPNLQNIPIRTSSGRRIREAFVPGPGYDLLLSADYRQIEMRIMAHASGDPNLISAINSGEDLHTSVAALAFGVPLTDVADEQRRRAKAISYGLAYGQSAHGLAAALAIPRAEAHDLIDAFFTRFSSVRDYLDGLVDRARRTGYTETLFGRRRYLPELTSPNLRIVEAAERAALNAPIQGSAADIIKTAMISIDAQLRERGLRARMLLSVHDELLFELPAEELGELTAIVEDIMPRAANLSVPLEVSIGTGINWALAH